MRHNYVMREQEEDLQHQEETWREGKRISKAQEEAEEQKKQAEMYACMNTEQQVPEYQQAREDAIDHAKEQECVHTAQKYNEIPSHSSSLLSSDDLSKTSSYDSYDSGTRQKPTKIVT